MITKIARNDSEIACQELKEAIGAEKVRDDEIMPVTYSRISYG